MAELGSKIKCWNFKLRKGTRTYLEGAECDSAQIDAQNHEGKLLALVQGEFVGSGRHRKDLWIHEEVERLDQAQTTHAPHVGRRVIALR